MCKACLNVSTQPCNHRWYQLVQPCEPGFHLDNCTNRLQLQGWETRQESCPFCDESDEPVRRSTHRLFGRVQAFRSAYTPVTPSEPFVPTRPDRTGSSGTVSTMSRHSSASSSTIAVGAASAVAASASPTLDRGQFHRERNDRLLIYLTNDPHEVLPSARKNYPTYSGVSRGDDSSSGLTTATSSDAASIRPQNRRRHSSISSARSALSRGWRSSIKLGKGVSRFSTPLVYND